jgi:adenosylcobinamide-phosphate synthase
MPDFTALSLALCAGVLLDRLLGEPARWHPLAGFGRIASALEARLNRGASPIARGAIAWAIAILPWVILAAAAHWIGGAIAWSLDVLLLYFALGARSLGEHARAVATPLEQHDLLGAREQLARMVSRDTNALSEVEVAAATTESVLENGNDAVFGTLFWFLVGGAAVSVGQYARCHVGLPHRALRSLRPRGRARR